MHIEFNTRVYELSHGKPKGYGSWMFTINDDKTEYTVPGAMTYTDAKKYMRNLVKANAAPGFVALITVLP